MLDLLAINLPYEYPQKLNMFSRNSRSPCNTRGGTIYYPYYLALCVAYAKKEGFNGKVIDAVIEKLSSEEVINVCLKENPKVILIDTSTPSIMNDIIIADRIQVTLPKSKVILVGRHMTYDGENALKLGKNLKYFVKGYFFDAILDILKENSLKKIKNLSYKENGVVINNNVKDIDLSDMPFVSEIYKEQLDIKKYFYVSLRYPYILLNFALGCAFNCEFCNEYKKHCYKHRPIDNIIDELKYIKKELPNVKEILFDDSTFVVNEELTQQLCSAITDNKINLPFTCMSRANISLETLKQLKQAGLRMIHIGLESTSQADLDRINKGMNVSDEIEYLNNCKKVGILNHVCFVIGIPGSTEDSIRKMMNDVCKLPSIDTIQAFPLIPTPGLPLYDWLKRKGYLLTEDYSKWLKPKTGLYNCVVSYPDLSNDKIEQLVEEFYKKFYCRPSYVMYKAWQSVRNLDEMKRNLKGFSNLLSSIKRGR